MLTEGARRGEPWINEQGECAERGRNESGPNQRPRVIRDLFTATYCIQSSFRHKLMLKLGPQPVRHGAVFRGLVLASQGLVEDRKVMRGHVAAASGHRA